MKLELPWLLASDVHSNKQVNRWPKCWPNVKLTWCSTAIGYQMPLPGGTADFTGQTDPKADQMASWSDVVPLLVTRCLWGYIWPQVYVTKVVTHMATRCLSMGGRVRLTFCVIESQPASQLANYNWPANHPCDKISTCQALGWSDIWWQEDRDPDHTGPLSRVQALPLVPLREWPTWPRPGKWYKWALQLVIYLWHNA